MALPLRLPPKYAPASWISVFAGRYNAEMVTRSGPKYAGSSVVVATDRSVMRNLSSASAVSMSLTLSRFTGMRISISAGKTAGHKVSSTAFPYSNAATASALFSSIAIFMGLLLNSATFFVCSYSAFAASDANPEDNTSFLGSAALRV